MAKHLWLGLLLLDLVLSVAPLGQDDLPWDDLYEEEDNQVPWGADAKYKPMVVGSKEPEKWHKHRHSRNTRRGQVNEVATSPSTADPYEVTSETVTAEPEQFPANCSHCKLREANKNYRLEQIRKDILAKLRLDKPPVITDKRLPQIPEIDEWLNKMHKGHDEPIIPGEPGDPVVRIISMLNLAQQPPKEKHLQDMPHVCYFEFHPDVEPSDIISAKLGVFVRPVKFPSESVTMFLIYRVKPPRRRGNTLIKRKRVHLNADDTNRWHKFTVDSVVKSWVRNSENNYGLQIMIYDTDGNSLAIVEPNNSTEELYKPYIEVEIREKSNSRERRMTGLDCHEEDVETRCCRYPLLVDFESYGWDWIIQPKRYPAYYCAGECTMAFLMSTAYGHLIQQSSIATGPCCTPRKMSPISMLYYDQDSNIVYGTLPSMVVDRCGCT